jgi:outer membrane lipoprotein LolB
MIGRRLACLVALAALSACTSAPRQSNPRLWSGRLALQVHSEPAQHFHAAFELQGSATQGELTLLSPLGSVLARLSWTPQQASLERGNERWIRPTVEQLAMQLVQTPLPVQTLFDWIEGRDTAHAGWQVDQSQHPQGQITARRSAPDAPAVLRIVLDR